MATIPEAKPSHGAEREDQVRTLFSEIAPRYDHNEITCVVAGRFIINYIGAAVRAGYFD